jgi:hypothetical protein
VLGAPVLAEVVRPAAAPQPPSGSATVESPCRAGFAEPARISCDDLIGDTGRVEQVQTSRLRFEQSDA